MTDAALLVALANARSDRRPSHARERVAHDGLADPASAGELLAPLLQAPVAARELPALRAAQRAVVAIVDAVIEGSPPPLDGLNAIAEREPVICVLERGPDGRPVPRLRPRRASVMAALLVALFEELGELEPSRLRRCERSECRLVFYDTSRSGTQRWHAERPCGLRERQRRHRAR
ncbi:MAG TPA: CGNR zinc finger domain-containing protein [Solirubrobacteraceae bacterium]|nr:CGNR zinc finger domain-containing protein [Solirubrobacteraceae bacterium]